jgi:hypothetical protein
MGEVVEDVVQIAMAHNEESRTKHIVETVKDIKEVVEDLNEKE